MRIPGLLLIALLASCGAPAADPAPVERRGSAILIEGREYRPIQGNRLVSSILGGKLQNGVRYVCDCIIMGIDHDVRGEPVVLVADPGSSSFEQAFPGGTGGIVVSEERLISLKQEHERNGCGLINRCQAFVLFDFDSRRGPYGLGVALERIVYRGTSQGVFEQIAADFVELAS